MSTANYPFSGLVPYVTKTPQFSTVVVRFGSMAEQRLALSASPQWIFELAYDADDMNLFAAEADAIMAFFLARRGAYDTFYFQNPEEAYRTTVWQANTSYSLGAIVRPPTANGRSYKCTTAGTSASSAPTWPTSFHGTVADGSVIWTENSYRVRFEADLWQAQWFHTALYRFGKVTLREVAS